MERKSEQGSGAEIKPLKKVRTTESDRMDSRSRNQSGRSVASYGTMGDDMRRHSLRKRGSVCYIKRTGSTATTDHPFERQASVLSSAKSLASIRTRHTSVSRSEYHHDLKVDLKTPLNTHLVLTAFTIVFGSSFLFGYNIGVLNQPALLIKDFYNQTYIERQGYISPSKLTLLDSLTTAIFIPSGFAGTFLAGFLADRVGRKKTILLSHLFTFIGVAIATPCVAAKSPEMLMIGRLFFGLNSGFGNCIAPMYLSEIAPVNLRGGFGTLHQLSITLGILLSSVFGLKELLGTATLWPYLMLLEAVPSLVSLIVLPFLPESPRFLLLVKGQREEARKAVQFYRRKEDVTIDMEEMDTENAGPSKAPVEDEKNEAKESFGVIQLMKSADLRRPLGVACMLQVIQQFSGINAIFFYSSDIFKGADIKPHHIPYAVVGTNAVNVIMTVIAVPLMDIAGRRMLLLIPMALMIGDLVLILVALNLTATYSWMAYISVVCILIYVICFAVGLGPIPMMIASELFRQAPRPSAMAVAGSVNWLTTFIIALSFKSISELTGNFTFMIFLVCLILFFLFTYFFVPETRNKTFEEIAHKFSPGQAIEVEEMLDDVFDEMDGDEPLANEEGDHEEHHLVTLNFNKGGSPDGGMSPDEVKVDGLEQRNEVETKA